MVARDLVTSLRADINEGHGNGIIRDCADARRHQRWRGKVGPSWTHNRRIVGPKRFPDIRANEFRHFAHGIVPETLGIRCDLDKSDLPPLLIDPQNMAELI